MATRDPGAAVAAAGLIRDFIDEKWPLKLAPGGKRVLEYARDLLLADAGGRLAHIDPDNRKEAGKTTMTRYLHVKNLAGVPDSILRVKTDLDIDGLYTAIHEAVAEFLSDQNYANAAENALSATRGKFTWNDLALWLPEDIQKRHGFEILDATTEIYAVGGPNSLLPDGEACADLEPR